MQADATDNKFTVRSLLQFPFDQWHPDSLITRANDKGIPFQTSNHRAIVATHLHQNKEKIQSAFEKSMRPIIDIQNKIREGLKSKKIEELDFLNEGDSLLVRENLQTYIDALNIGQWVLPVEGFLEPTTSPEEIMPKCLGQVSMYM